MSTVIGLTLISWNNNIELMDPSCNELRLDTDCTIFDTHILKYNFPVA